MSDENADAFADWWRTSIIDMQPGIIRLRGYPIEDLIGRTSFAAMVWLMLRGELPTDGEAALLEAALVAAVDHGPQAPSIAIARMAMTCGVGINNAMASGINALGDIHGGAAQQAMEIYREVAEKIAAGVGVDEAADTLVAARLAKGSMIEGFGHRFHPVDPRTPRLLELVDLAVAKRTIDGRFAAIGRSIKEALTRHKKRALPMNIDGITAIIYSELGFSPELGRGLFILSRSVGILAHSWEQRLEGGRIKGPAPRGFGYRYTGPTHRTLEERP